MQYIGYKNSMNNLGNFRGMVDDSGRGDDEILYGACFKPIKYKPRYYETYIKYKGRSPWLGAPNEGTFMNALKRNNEPPVQTYKELVLFPVPTERYQSVEGFGSTQNSTISTIIIILIIIVLLYLLINK
jgi:hypothetical protein